MNTHRALVASLGVALCALASAVSAQALANPDEIDKHAPGAKAYSCVDPSDALARRWFQDEPCRWPMIHLPMTGVASSDEPRRWPAYPPRVAGAQDGHAMFWRFPVQPMGPQEVPRHSWR